MGKWVHADCLAVAEGIDVGKSSVLPCVAALGANAGVHKDDDLLSDGEENCSGSLLPWPCGWA
jgi:hypothetical protein